MATNSGASINTESHRVASEDIEHGRINDDMTTPDADSRKSNFAQNDDDSDVPSAVESCVDDVIDDDRTRSDDSRSRSITQKDDDSEIFSALETAVEDGIPNDMTDPCSRSFPQWNNDSDMLSRVDTGRGNSTLRVRLPETPTSILSSPTVDTSGDSSFVGMVATRQNPEGSQQTINFEHSVKARDDGIVSGGRRLTKPVMALISTIALLSSGGAAYLFSEWLSVPGLKTQVDRLETQVGFLELQVSELESQVDRLQFQVDRLNGEVDRLENETDRFALLNAELEQTVADFTTQNNNLNSSLLLFTELNNNLNSTVTNLEEENAGLKNQIDGYVLLNGGLNQTINDLTGQVLDLDRINNDLSELNDDLWFAINTLSNETATLTTINIELNETVLFLQDEVILLEEEINRLDRLSTNLATVVSFLNETAVTIDDSVDMFVDYLDREININRGLVLGALNSLYLQRISFWDCDFREYFLSEPFVQNRNVPIGNASFGFVLNYVEERVLSDLCLDVGDYEKYLGERFVRSFPPSGATYNQIVRSVGSYTDEAFRFYFLGDGLTPEQWAGAGYNCDNFPQDALFRAIGVD